MCYKLLHAKVQQQKKYNKKTCESVKYIEELSCGFCVCFELAFLIFEIAMAPSAYKVTKKNFKFKLIVGHRFSGGGDAKDVFNRRMN